MEPKFIFGVLINLVAWPLIIYWIWYSRKSEKEADLAYQEYNRPENKYKRRIIEIGLTLEPYLNNNFYPYIEETNHSLRQRAAVLRSVDDVDYMPLYDISVGACEKTFFRLLTDHFGNECLKLGGFSVCGYYPDVIFIDIKELVYIDIEIDEPFTFKTKNPIHYKRSISQDGSKIEDANKERDGVLTKNGWTVIRFSEDQVQNNPNACIHLIEYVIAYLRAEQPYYRLQDIELSLSKRWTKDEAKSMAFRNHRGY